MAVTIICPNLICRSVLQVGDTMRGQKVRCARCGKAFRVPDGNENAKTKPAPETQKAPSK